MKTPKVNVNRPQPSPGEVAARREFMRIQEALLQQQTTPFFKKPGWIASTVMTVIVATVIVAWVWVGGGGTQPMPPTEANPPVAAQTAMERQPDQQPDNAQDFTRIPDSQGDSLAVDALAPVSETAQEEAALLAAAKAAPNLAGIKPLPPEPFFKDLEVPFASYNIPAKKGGIINHPSGTVIKIPEDAFETTDGKTVKGVIKVRYREINDPVDMLLTNVPMHYDSSGQHQLESAGMMEIRAYQDGMPVKLRSGKPIQVALASPSESTSYNLYRLEDNRKNWAYKGKDTVYSPQNESETSNFTLVPEPYTSEKIIDAKPVLGNTTKVQHRKHQYGMADSVATLTVPKGLDQVRAAIDSLTTHPPLKPDSVNAANYTFDIAVDPEEFPELHVYHNKLFEVRDQDIPFSREFYNIVWDNAELEKGDRKGSYSLLLSYENEAYKLRVYPVLEGMDYTQALAEYETLLAQHDALLKANQQEEAAIVAAHQEKMAQMQADRQAQLAKWQRAAQGSSYPQDEATEISKVAASSKGYWYRNTTKKTGIVAQRIFSVATLGIYNCDRILRYPQIQKMQPTFVMEDGTPFEGKTVFHLDCDKNTLFTFKPEQQPTFQFYEGGRNYLFVALPGNKMAVFTPDHFRQLDLSKSRQQTITLKTVDQPFHTVQDMKAYLLGGSTPP